MDEQGFYFNGKRFMTPTRIGDHWLNTEDYDFLEVKNSDIVLVLEKYVPPKLSGEEINRKINVKLTGKKVEIKKEVLEKINDKATNENQTPTDTRKEASV